MFAGTARGLALNKEERATSYPAQSEFLDTSQISSVWPGAEGGVWAGRTQGHVVFYEGVSKSIRGFPFSWSINALLQSTPEHLWVGLDGGLMSLKLREGWVDNAAVQCVL